MSDFALVATDLDGTLIDSAADIHAAVNLLFSRHDLPIDLPNQVPVCIENIPVFTGQFGIANGMNAVKITATHPPGTRPRVPVIQEDPQ